MMDPFDALLRERITRLLVAVPTEPAPGPSRSRRMTGRGTSRRRLVLSVGLGLLLLATLLVSLPTLSKPTYQAQLRAAGVPEGVEIIAWGADEKGDLFDIVYRDNDGQVHLVNQFSVFRYKAPDGTVYKWGDPPKATPPPRP